MCLTDHNPHNLPSTHVDDELLKEWETGVLYMVTQMTMVPISSLGFWVNTGFVLHKALLECKLNILSL